MHRLFFHDNYALFRAMMLCLISTAVFAADSQQHEDLYSQIKSLAEQHQFVVIGLEKIGDEGTINAEGTVQQQIALLMTSFNHIIIRNDKAGIERLIILDKKTANHLGRIIVPIVTKNNHYFINASIKGTDNIWIDLELLIDTGANSMVLPLSMMGELKLAIKDMQQSQLQTVNGKVDAYTGHLPALEVGNEIVENIAVAFVEDSLMGDYSLLGMSFLGLYRFVIDDEQNQISLERK
ncbi:MAG: clan AA aspartic protease [Methylococcales bacterium]|nr:clan AA aspartic protease [Methylococcales bacterium]